MSWSKAIAYLKHSSGANFAELAEGSGLDSTFLYHLLSGRRLPSLDTIERLSTATSVSILELFTVAYAEDIAKLGQTEIQSRFKLAMEFAFKENEKV